MHARAPAHAPRSAQVDSLRAIAALAVVGMHVGSVSGVSVDTWYGAFTSHLNVGVTLFFLISGFLLYRPWAVSLLEGTPSPGIVPYARRRLLRIMPAYWVALTALALWPGLERVLTAEWWVFYSLFPQSYRLDWSFAGIAPAWSLSVEANFYAALPLYASAVALVCRKQSPRVRLHLAAAALAVVGAVGGTFYFEVQRRNLLNWALSLPALLLWFAAGMALALASARFDGRMRESRVVRLVADHPVACWALAAAVYIGFCLDPEIPRAMSAKLYSPVQRLTEHVVYTLVSLFVMLPTVFGASAGGWPRRLLETGPLATLGLVSYGVFLWHLPLLLELKRRGFDRLVPDWPFLSLALVILPIAVACGAASYLLIERPAIRLGRRWGSER